jgi:quinoprotein glucose dehydrogenase
MFAPHFFLMNRPLLFSIAMLLATAGSVFSAPPPAPVAHGDGKAEAGAKDGANAIKTFKFDAGLKVELWANEPLLANPVSFATDERGRWFIAESYRQEGRQVNGKPSPGGVVDNRGHMNWLDADISSRSTDERLAMMHKFFPDPKKFAETFETNEERIVVVEDSKGTGRADKSTIFADGFRDALDGTGAGILARGNEVWWTCIPNLWHFADSNGDGKSDTKEKLLSGFGVKFAFRGHDMHGLRFGPDGKLYWSIGDRGLNVKNKEGRQLEVTETGAILRANPDGTDFEVFATGVRNPQELAFDEFGNLFTGDNNSDSGDKARFVQLVEGGDCGWRMTFQYLEDRGPWNRELLWDEKEGPKARYIVPPIANLSNGPSGLTYNPGTGLSKKYAGKFYLSDFRGGASASVVHEIALEPAGAWHKLKERRDLIKGVLTTDVEFGTDGALYVLDWVEGWSGVDKGRIFKFTDPAADTAKQAEVKKLLAEGMVARPAAELEKLLAHDDQRIRQAAQFQLAAKGDTETFTRAAKSGPSTLARIHAGWGLGQLAKKQPQVLTTVAALLDDKDGEVRAQAARVLGDHRFKGAYDKLIGLLKDAHPRARFYAGIALGKSGYKPAVDPLFAMLAENADKDPILRHAGIMGLAGCADAATLAARANHANVAVRGAAVVALRRLKSAQVAVFLKGADQSVVLEAARAIHDVPIIEAMPALAALLTDKRITDRNILLRVVNANYRLGQPANAKALVTFAADNSANEAGRKEALTALAAWANPNPKDRLLYLWRPLPQRTNADAVAALAPAVSAILAIAPGSVAESAAVASAKLGLRDGADALFALVANDKAGKGARTEALRALASLKDSRLANAAKEALTDRDPKLRAEGLKALVAADPVAALTTVSDVLSSNAPVTEKQGAVAALAESRTPEAEKLLAGLMDSLIAGKLAPEVQLDVYEAAKKRPGLSARIQQWTAALPKTDPLALYRLSLAGGDIERGKKIFREHQIAQCFKCHQCEGGDSLVGPDLTKIGATKDRNYLLESIVFPNTKIAEGFQIVVLELTDGTTVVGRLLRETKEQLQVVTLDEKGKQQNVNVPAKKVKTRTSAPSPMPEIIRDQLSRQELRDVLEYLATRK